MKRQKQLLEKFEKITISRVSIDQEFPSIDWMSLSIDQTGIENWSSQPKTLW